MTGKPAPLDYVLPDWLEKGIEPSLRDSEDEIPVPNLTSSASGATRSRVPSAVTTPVILTPTNGSLATSSRKDGSYTDLNKFYEDESDNNDDSDESEEGGHENDDYDESESDGSDGQQASSDDGQNTKAAAT